MAASFIQSQCLVSVGNVVVQAVVGKLFPLHPPNRSHGIPHADEVRLALAGETALEPGGDVVVALAAVYVGHVGDQILAPLGRQTALMQHTGQHPNGVSATAVPEQVDFVRWLVAGHEVPVGFPDIAIQTLAGYPHARR